MVSLPHVTGHQPRHIIRVRLKLAPHTLADQIPTVCTVADICRILQISQGTFYLQSRKGTFPIPRIDPPIDSRPRFFGEHVRQYLEGRVASPTRGRTTRPPR